MRMTERIEFDGQAGAAGLGTGAGAGTAAAAVRPTPVEGGTLLDYDVTATTGGTLARTGSRSMDLLAR
jgi:carbon monoxide dehydrogenase subunit G